MQIKELSSVAATWVGLIAAIIGGYATISGYREQAEKQVDQRKLQTFRLIEQYNSTEMHAIREKILKLVQRDSFCQQDQRRAAGLADTEIFSFVEFYDMLAVCLDAKLCDNEVAYTFFGPYANPHWPSMRPVIEATRRAEQDAGLPRPFGYGLERLARKPYVSRCTDDAPRR